MGFYILSIWLLKKLRKKQEKLQKKKIIIKIIKKNQLFIIIIIIFFFFLNYGRPTILTCDQIWGRRKVFIPTLLKGTLMGQI